VRILVFKCFLGHWKKITVFMKELQRNGIKSQ
jgi:hypothetical protein